MMRFRDARVIVTGAASGIGRATARLFADEGATVLAADVSDNLAETSEGYRSITVAHADAGSEEDVAALVARITAAHGGLDIFVANAGISGGASGIFDLGVADWTDMLRVNLIGPFLAIRHAARAMVDAGTPGAIVCTASVAGLRSGAGNSAYSASKAGVISLVQTASQQLADTGIRVNAVCPGLIETGMTRLIFDDARQRGRADRIGQLNPLKRGGEPAEVARVIAFLASSDASYLNGQAIAVDGGLSSSHPVSRPPRLGVVSF